MQRLRAIVLAAVLLAAGLGHAPVAIAASVDDWRVDLDAMRNTLVLQHPDPYTRIGREAFARNLESLKRRLPELSEEQRVVEAMRLVASIGDGHTFLEPTGDAFKAWYPIRLYRFSDGIFVTSAHTSVAELAGAQMLDIGGMPAAEALDRARGLMGADNDVGASENVAALSNAGLAKGLGLADASGALPVKVRLRDGRVRALKLAPQPGGSGLGWRFRSEVFGASIGDYPDWVAAFARRLPARSARPIRRVRCTCAIAATTSACRCPSATRTTCRSTTCSITRTRHSTPSSAVPWPRSTSRSRAA